MRGKGCGKNAGKHPRLASWKEFQERLPLEEEVREWWGRWPSANLGLVTGRVSKVIVMDLDGEEGVRAVRERGGLPPTPVVRTGRGWHYYFVYPEGVERVPPRVKVLPGVDMRGDGGMAVLPPSLHLSGRRYEWAKGRSPWDVPLAPCPEWLLELVEAGKNKEATRIQESPKEPGWVEQLLAGVPEGMRDDACTRLAGHFLAKGLPESEVLALLLTWNQRNQPPLPESQVEKCVRSVARREARKPPRRREASVLTTEKQIKLPGRVAIPPEWDRCAVVVTLDWSLAREAYASGKAAVVAYPDLTVPPEAARALREAAELEVAAAAEEERARLEWALCPLLIARQAQAQAQGQPAPAPVPGQEQGHIAQERPALRPAPEPLPLPAGWRPSWERQALAWAHEHAPRLAAWALALEERAKNAWAWEPWAEEEAWAEWELARRELRRAWEEAAGRARAEGSRKEVREGHVPEEGPEAQGQAPGNAPEQAAEGPPAAGDGPGERELSFAEAEALFGGFDAVWELTDAQAAALEKIFAAKGPALVRVRVGWLGAEEWQERLARTGGRA